MRKRMCLFPGMAVVLLFTILFAAGYTTPAIGNVNTVQAATKKKDISREGKKKRSIIKGKIFELEVDKPESVKDKIKSVYLIATRDLSNLWLQFFLSQNQGFMRLFEKTVLK